MAPPGDLLRLSWHSGGGAQDSFRHAALAAALAPHGVTLAAGDDPGGNAASPALLHLATADPGGLAQVARLSRGGRLAVTLADEVASDIGLGWRLLALGASEILPWSQLLARPASLAARLRRWRTIDAIVASPLVRANLVGASPSWIALLRRLVEVAHFTTAPILLLGDSGTGKELLARLIHTLDTRADKRELIVLDCTTVMPELSGSEFFGHERGAFTNAHAARDGAFALANLGTLFLDEVGEMPPPMQAQLLRVVQEKTFKRLGSNAWQRTEFRLVCATNRDLTRDTHEGGFRRDLYYRLAGWVFHVPSLSDRREDILPLARHFLAATPKDGPESPGIEPAVEAWLQARDYPGNIRELRQLMLRIGHRHIGEGPIGPADIPDDERPQMSVELPWPDQQFESAVQRGISLGFGLRDISRIASEVAVRAAVRSHSSLHEAARTLGVTDRALQLRQASARDVRAFLN